MSDVIPALAIWSRRRWLAAGLGSVAVALLVAVPTAVIPNPVFGRAVAVTWWSYPVVVLTGLLGGLLLATYVREPGDDEQGTDTDVAAARPGRLGTWGGLLSFFAVGCPVCNKVVLLALGTTGAITWFAPIQPLLAVASLVLLAVAVRDRLRGQLACPMPARSLDGHDSGAPLGSG